MNYLETLKNITNSKNKKIENIVFILILLILLLFFSNYIFKDEKVAVKTMNENTSQTQSNKEENDNELIEKKLENILSQIAGISDVSVALTYNNNGSDTPIYNTKETTNDKQTTTEKNVAYNEQDGDKTAVIASSSLPSVEGAIIVAKGADSTQMKSKIANAVAICLGIPVYKVQVFEKE